MSLTSYLILVCFAVIFILLGKPWGRKTIYSTAHVCILPIIIAVFIAIKSITGVTVAILVDGTILCIAGVVLGEKPLLNIFSAVFVMLIYAAASAVVYTLIH